MQPFKYKPKVNNGDLRHLIDVYGNVEYRNSLGEKAYRFEKISSLWANVIPQTGSLQNQQADTILTNVTHKIIVRYSAGKDITKDMELRYKDHRFSIKYILNPYFSNETLEVFVEEVLG